MNPLPNQRSRLQMRLLSPLAILCFALAVAGRGAFAQERGRIGVTVQQVTDDIADTLGIFPVRGILEASVSDRSLAKTADVQPRGMIVRFYGHELKTPRELQSIVGDRSANKYVELVVIHFERKRKLTVKVEARVIPDCKRALMGSMGGYNRTIDDRVLPELQDSRVQEIASEVAESLRDETVTPTDIANGLASVGRLMTKFRSEAARQSGWSAHRQVPWGSAKLARKHDR